MAEAAPKARLIAILGEMRELGDESPQKHFEIGQEAGAQGIDIVIAIGDRDAKQLALGAASAGVANVAVCADKETATQLLQGITREGDVMLIKGANATQLWTIGQVLNGEAPTAH
ncbi:UDP-N-acetylmuramoylalanyl-D-glutamate--2,6-diaminopimelate ligase [Streptomyces roseifaciens]